MQIAMRGVDNVASEAPTSVTPLQGNIEVKAPDQGVTVTSPLQGNIARVVESNVEIEIMITCYALFLSLVYTFIRTYRWKVTKCIYMSTVWNQESVSLFDAHQHFTSP